MSHTTPGRPVHTLVSHYYFCFAHHTVRITECIDVLHILSRVTEFTGLNEYDESRVVISTAGNPYYEIKDKSLIFSSINC